MRTAALLTLFTCSCAANGSDRVVEKIVYVEVGIGEQDGGAELPDTYAAAVDSAVADANVACVRAHSLVGRCVRIGGDGKQIDCFHILEASDGAGRCAGPEECPPPNVWTAREPCPKYLEAKGTEQACWTMQDDTKCCSRVTYDYNAPPDGCDGGTLVVP